MGIILSALGELGHGVAWRCFNSRYFGVPQRRLRVFIAGYFGAVCPGEVLFEREGGAGNIKEGGEAQADIARTVRGSSTAYSNRQGGIAVNLVVSQGGADDNDAYGGRLIPTLRANYRNNSNPVTEASMLITHSLRSEGADASEDGTGRGTPLVAAPLTARDAKGPLPDRALGNAINDRIGVRRLTPRECERLQGFPDDWTRWDAEGNEISDSARYRLLGNAVTVPVIEWLGQRIKLAASSSR